MESSNENTKPRGAGRASASKPNALKPGDTCPTCGGIVGRPEETVTFTTSELADARKAFEELVDRHIATRDAGGASGEDK